MKHLLAIIALTCVTAHAQTKSQFEALQAQVIALQKQVTALQQNKALALAPFVSVDGNTQAGVRGPNITFSGANIRIVNGTGSTAIANGQGNLIIGYDEDTVTEPNNGVFGPIALTPTDRSGSHNLVIGRWHRFNSSAFGCLVAGEGNSITGEGNSIVGGQGNNIVNGSSGNVIVGGGASTASGIRDVIVGGWGQSANSNCDVIVGGSGNETHATACVIVGGIGSYTYPVASASVTLGGYTVLNSAVTGVVSAPITASAVAP